MYNCLNHLYTVKLIPSNAMQLRTHGHNSEYCQLSSMNSTNETLLLVHFLITCDFVFVLHVIVQFLLTSLLT